MQTKNVTDKTLVLHVTLLIKYLFIDLFQKNYELKARKTSIRGLNLLKNMCAARVRNPPYCFATSAPNF